MTALILQATPFVTIAGSKFRAIYPRLLNALDAFVEARMRNAVPDLQLRRCQSEINRYRRLMHTEDKSRAKATGIEH